jgi:hypothetical protein
LAVIPVSILAGAWAGMTGLGAQNPPFPRVFFVLIAVLAPLALVVAIGACRSALRMLADIRRRRQR